MSATVVVSRTLVQALVRERYAFTPIGGALIDELEAALAVEIPWERFGRVLESFTPLEAVVDVRVKAMLDQQQAYAVDFFNKLDVDVTDERTAFTVLTAFGLVAIGAFNAFKEGAFNAEEAQAVRVVVRTFGAAVSRYMPEKYQRPEPPT